MIPFFAASMSRGRKTVEARVRLVAEARTVNFVELLRIAELDPTRDLRFADWSDVEFSDCDLTGFDFSGANLRGCLFEGAQIAQARFDAAQIDRRSLLRAKDWHEHVRSWTYLPKPPTGRHLPDLAVFSDAPFAPEMVVLPAGEFLMGSPENEQDRLKWERPQQEISIDRRFAIGRYPVTFDEYDYFCDAMKREKPDHKGWGRGRRPVINVEWQDAKAYCHWLTHVTGQDYRLPSEEEWEYACRAGTTTRYAFGNEITENQANFHDNVKMTTEVGSYSCNFWGLYDMHGNIWEWVMRSSRFNEAREAHIRDIRQGMDPDMRKNVTAEMLRGLLRNRTEMVRGGSWSDPPERLRSAFQFGVLQSGGIIDAGFRVARTLAI
ncbi:MAG: SUMF1/EgtB/PvdO family nonheme iron enzyme [Hyphomicrobiales bacterium]|nr:SUMF1/EgtB/PvdO family nonheme iron enzyme [Hyphomicrobiales bacterium]